MFGFSKRSLLKQMEEKRELPIGGTAFEAWSDRIISGALIPGATIESQKWTLATSLLSLGPVESYKSDGHFINLLRVAAIKETASYKMQEIKKAHAERTAAEQAAKEAANNVVAINQGEVTSCTDTGNVAGETSTQKA